MDGKIMLILYIKFNFLFYQPNPIPKNSNNLKNYGEWKRSVGIGNDSYQKALIDIIFDIQDKFAKVLTK